MKILCSIFHNLTFAGSRPRWNGSSSASDVQSNISSVKSERRFRQSRSRRSRNLCTKSSVLSSTTSELKELLEIPTSEVEVAVPLASNSNSIDDKQCESFFNLLDDLDLDSVVSTQGTEEVKIGSSNENSTNGNFDGLESWMNSVNLQWFEEDNSQVRCNAVESEMNDLGTAHNSQVDSAVSIGKDSSQHCFSEDPLKSQSLLLKDSALRFEDSGVPTVDACSGSKVRFKTTPKESCSKDDLLLFSSPQYSPAPSAASDSGYSEEGKVTSFSITSCTSQTAKRKLSVSSTASLSSFIELDETSQTSIQNLPERNKKSCIPSNPTASDVHPSLISVNCSSSVGEAKILDRKTLEPQVGHSSHVDKTPCAGDWSRTESTETSTKQLEDNCVDNSDGSSGSYVASSSECCVLQENGNELLESNGSETSLSSCYQSSTSSDSVKLQQTCEAHTDILPGAGYPLEKNDSEQKSDILNHEHRKKKRRKRSFGKHEEEKASVECTEEQRRKSTGRGRGRGRRQLRCNSGDGEGPQRVTRQRYGPIEVQAPASSKRQYSDASASPSHYQDQDNVVLHVPLSQCPEPSNGQRSWK